MNTNELQDCCQNVAVTKMEANEFGTFRDSDGRLHQCRYVGPVLPVNGLIYVDYCLDDGTPIKNAVIHMNDFMHEY